MYLEIKALIILKCIEYKIYQRVGTLGQVYWTSVKY